MELQTLFFRRLRERIPSHLSAENELTKLLNISLDDAFRLMRCLSPLSLEQAEKISTHYKIALDNIRPQAPGTIPFRYDAINYNAASIDDHFELILREFSHINLYGTNKMMYAASDLPVFPLFQFPALAAFKLFYWAKYVYNLPAFAETKLSLRHIPTEILQRGERTWKQYLKIPSVEIWSSNCMDNVLREIMVMWEHGEFETRADAHKVCDELCHFLDQIEGQAKHGKKFHPYMPLPPKENYTLYYSEIGITNNTLLIQSETATSAYISHNVLNFLHTDHEIFCLQMQRWFHNVIANAELISQANTDLRHRFFDRLRENVAYVKEQLK